MTTSRPTSNPLRRILDLLQSAKPAGSNSAGRTVYAAKCPSHDDRTASLSISEGQDGRVLIHCHAGCGTQNPTPRSRSRNCSTAKQKAYDGISNNDGQCAIFDCMQFLRTHQSTEQLSTETLHVLRKNHGAYRRRMPRVCAQRPRSATACAPNFVEVVGRIRTHRRLRRPVTWKTHVP